MMSLKLGVIRFSWLRIGSNSAFIDTVLTFDDKIKKLLKFQKFMLQTHNFS